MNLSEVTTPSDLLEANQLTNLEAALKAVGELNYSESREVVAVVLEAAVAFHKSLLSEALDEGNQRKFFALTQDLTNLETVAALLKSVS